ncbi:MAG: ABC transporter ATP-binding protein, partial [Arcobacteraceae bacterium]|nr:ABC transporter ATP-binding protein [Arcobacteraceae bacterium]
MALIEANNISFSYHNTPVLHNINFELHQGDVMALVGENGCGKTTLLKILMGLYASSGEIKIHSKSIKKYTRKALAKLISYVPQTHQIPFDYTVFDVVLMGRLAHISLFSNYSLKDKNIALACLEKVGMAHLTNRIYSQIS